MAKVVGLFLVLAAVAAVAAGAALLTPPGAVGAQGAECRDGGVVPGSVEVVSTNNLAGEASGHTIRFQLCRNSESAGRSIGNGIYLARPAEIGLLWHDWFYLEHPEQAGITLTATEDGKSWEAADAFAKRACSFWLAGTGVSVGFAGGELNDLSPPSKDAPVTLQFDIPEAAGMLNPTFPDDYQWRIVLRYDQGGHWETYTVESVAKVITPPLSANAGISISDSFVEPGSIRTVVGYGFRPNSRVQKIQVGWIDVTPDNPVATDAQGKFRLDIIIPGVDNGRYVLLAQVNGITATTTVYVYPVRYGSPDELPAMYALQNLGDNLVRAFHFNPESAQYEQWTFYDPELPDVSTLGYFFPQECYWILVRKPMEVILNRQTRQLTCRADGNCWNFIVW